MQLPDTIDHIRPSVVQIRRFSTQRAAGQTIGTGFIVADTQHVVTALHVVDVVNLSAGEAIHVALAAPNVDTPELKMRANFSEYEGKLIGVNNDQDLALIHVRQLKEPGFRVKFGPRLIEAKPVNATLRTNPLREGVELAVSGYPLAEPSLVTNAGILASTFTLNDNPSQVCYLGDFTANPGNSGGPVYTTRDGSVIGVCVAGKLAPIIGGVGTQSAGLTVIVPAAQVVSLLSAHGVQQSIPMTTAPRTSGRSKRRH